MRLHLILSSLVLLAMVVTGCGKNWENAETDALKQITAELSASGKYESKRHQLHSQVKSNPDDRIALLQLAYIDWGFDRFDAESLEESQNHLEVVMNIDPQSKVAARLQKFNDKWAKNIAIADSEFRVVEAVYAQITGKLVSFTIEEGGPKYKRSEEISGPVFIGPDGVNYLLACYGQEYLTPLELISKLREWAINDEIPTPS